MRGFQAVITPEQIITNGKGRGAEQAA